MESKKRLIRKMAFVAVALLVLGLAVLAAAAIVAKRREADRSAAIGRERAEMVGAARKYLGDVAGRITSVPVDPAVVGDIQAKYFEEYPRRRKFVWGMGANGEFLFGVPAEAFARLNAAWDAHESSIRGEGLAVDQQDFLRRLVDSAEELDLESLAPEEPELADLTAEGADQKAPVPPRRPSPRWSRWRHHGDFDDWLVLSAPLKASDGASLGNLYLKMDVGMRGQGPWAEDPAQDVGVAGGALAGTAFAFLWLLVPTWVYVDARERGVRRAMLWSFLVLISLVVGLVVYLIARPEEARRLQCPGCGREVDGGAYCPHCGHDLATAFCATCRYPLKPEWSFCPSCRTEVRRPAAGAAAVTAEG